MDANGSKPGVKEHIPAGGDLERGKIDVDKFGSPTSYQIFPSILRMRCAKMCARGTGCRRGRFSARCMQC